MTAAVCRSRTDKWACRGALETFAFAKKKRHRLAMLDDETWAQINGKYACPPDAGPAWRQAAAVGFDMSLIEHALTLTPEQRLDEHQQVIDFLLKVLQTGPAHGAK